jgi:hypothetical protein
VLAASACAPGEGPHRGKDFILSGRALLQVDHDLPPNLHIGLCRDLIANPDYLVDQSRGCMNSGKCHYFSRGTDHVTCNRVSHFAADLVEHCPLNSSDLLIIPAVNWRPLDLIAADQRCSLPSGIYSGCPTGQAAAHRRRQAATRLGTMPFGPLSDKGGSAPPISVRTIRRPSRRGGSHPPIW